MWPAEIIRVHKSEAARIGKGQHGRPRLATLESSVTSSSVVVLSRFPPWWCHYGFHPGTALGFSCFSCLPQFFLLFWPRGPSPSPPWGLWYVLGAPGFPALA